MSTEAFGPYQTPARMAQKLRAIPFPGDLSGLSVLDIGCDHGFWCHLASERGAARVVGFDRGRDVKGVGFVDLPARNAAQGWPRCEFVSGDLGADWPNLLPDFDLVLCLSMYHHAWANCRDHGALWEWLFVHTHGFLLWEGPLDNSDGVARTATGNDPRYNAAAIREAADTWFDVERVGRAGHVSTREVWRCTPR